MSLYISHGRGKTRLKILIFYFFAKTFKPKVNKYRDIVINASKISVSFLFLLILIELHFPLSQEFVHTLIALLVFYPNKAYILVLAQMVLILILLNTACPYQVFSKLLHRHQKIHLYYLDFSRPT